ncbi:MAG TPA: hypothetical protein VFP64_16430 [Pyrinomonadaceae bacterium]|nr:hypothetical protein [Pyrinomonadaceae bacterium]
MNHDEFRDYLLGSLEAERRTAVEERILIDPSAYEELLAAEEELIDQYLRGGLSKPEQHKFETHFLITAERHKNLRFGKLLKRYVDAQFSNLTITGEKLSPDKNFCEMFRFQES